MATSTSQSQPPTILVLLSMAMGGAETLMYNMVRLARTLFRADDGKANFKALADSSLISECYKCLLTGMASS